MIESITEVLRQNAHPEFVTVMASESVDPELRRRRGIQGGLDRLAQPIRGFPDRVRGRDPVDDKLVFLVRQVATTQHSGVEIETESAAVWWPEDGQIRQAAFYLDRQEA